MNVAERDSAETKAIRLQRLQELPPGVSLHCNGCGRVLTEQNAWMEDGCPCNSPRGINENPLEIIDGCGCYVCLLTKPPVMSSGFAQTAAEERFIVCKTCGNKRCPKATYHKNECLGNNNCGLAGSRWHIDWKEPPGIRYKQPSSDSHSAQAMVSKKIAEIEALLNKDETMPTGPWQFDKSVTEVFDDMLQRSIPAYDEMRAACNRLAGRFIQDDAAVVDLGCSKGDAIAGLLKDHSGRAKFIGVEASEPMVKAARERFAREITSGFVHIHQRDLRRWYPQEQAGVTLAILTLQFIPVNYRQKILAECYRRTLPGGALLAVEKVLGDGEKIDDALVAEYHALKTANGYSAEQIARKAMALEGTLVPYTARQNEGLLRGAGFEEVDCFWRCLNFAGWLAVKRAGGGYS